MTNKLLRDLIIGAVILVGCVYLVFVTFGLPKGSARFPQLVLGCIIFMDIIMMIQSYGKEKGKKDSPRPEGCKFDCTPYVIFAFVVAFIAMFRIFGYFVATPLLLVGLMLYFKTRSWKLLVGVPVVYCAFVYALFVWQFKLPLI